MSTQNQSDAFSSLLSDPRALSGIAELLSTMQKSTPPEEQSRAEPARGAEGASPSTEPSAAAFSSASTQSSPRAPDMSGILSAVLSNPEMLSALPSVMSMLSGMMGSTAASAPSNPAPAAAVLPAFLSGAQGTKNPAPIDRRCALLMALKPYMPEDKRSTVDTIVRVIEIMSLIK